MTFALMTLAGTGLVGCFLATLSLDLAGRGTRAGRVPGAGRRLARPRTLTIRYE